MMSCMQLPLRLKQSSTMHSNRSYRPLWLTSNSFEFPNYALLHPELNKQVALVLYYAHVMDQKKILKDFFRVCKDSFENKCEGNGLESAMKTWIKHSILKLHRRREQIISNAVTTFQTEMIRRISRILLSVFCDLLRKSSDKVSCFKALPKEQTSVAVVSNHCASCTLFSENGVLLPRTSNSMDFSERASAWDQLCFPFRGNKNLAMSVSKNNLFDWLHKFWVTFCYRPDPSNSIYNKGTTMKMANCSHTSRGSMSYLSSYLSYLSWKTTVVNRTSRNCIIIEAADLDLNCMVLKLTDSNLMNHNKDCSSRNDQAMSPCESNEGSSSTWSQEDSESSDCWSFNDFAGEISDEENGSISKSYHSNLDRCNPTLSWLQSTSSHFIKEDFDSDDDCVVFADVITEENCLDRGRTNGSLYFIDTDDDDDFDVKFPESSAVVRFPTDTYEAKSQGYWNPCFEDEIRSFSVPKYIKTVNECWIEMMQDTESKPRQASKVSFAPEPSLVKIHCFQKTEENSYDPSVILDRLRFQRRIKGLNHMLAPFFTSEHRKEIEQRNGFYQD